MEPLWKLVYLLEPHSIILLITAIAVTYASASRALIYGKEMERNRDLSEASITLDSSQALMIPIMSSCSLLVMFYLFSSVSQFLTVFTTVASASALYFCLSPYVAHIKSQFSLSDPYVSQCCSKPFTRIQSLLLFVCIALVMAWIVSGHWILNNILGISLCIAFVSHVRLPNIKICAMLLFCLFLYDIFWVFYSGRIFGANIMVSVATQQASNPAFEWNCFRVFSRPAVLITDAYNALLRNKPPRRKRNREFLDAILRTLRADGNILVPVDTAGRVLELLLILEQTCHSLINESELENVPDGPKIVLASMASLEVGFSHDIFVEWAADVKNLVLFTERGQFATLARMLQSDPPPKAVKVIMSKRIPLVGEELAAYEEEQDLKRKEEALKAALIKEEESKVSPSAEPAEDDPMVVDTSITNPSSNSVGLQHGAFRDVLIDGFVPPPSTAAPMFPFYENSAEWDDFGEVINPG